MARNRYAHHLYHLYHVDSPSRNHLCPKLAPRDWNCIPQKMKKVHKTFFWKSRNLEVDTYEQDQVGRNGNWAVQRLLWWRSNRFLGSGFHLPLARPIPYHRPPSPAWFLKVFNNFPPQIQIEKWKREEPAKMVQSFHGNPQIASLRGCKVTLVAFVWPDARRAKTKDPTQ